MKTAIVTGGSKGIGKAISESLLKAGCRVYELSRTPEDNSLRSGDICGVTHITADVADEKSVIHAIDYVYNKEGRLDILVNCAGMGISGAVEFTKSVDARRQLDVNFYGIVYTTKAVLPKMRMQKYGRIVNVSSVAGPIPIPFQTFYSVSKAAINAYTCALANEVIPYGITVTAVMPGDSSSGFTKARKKELEGDAEYGGRISRSVAVMEHDEINGTPPETVGAYVAKIALKKNVRPLYAVGLKYKFFCTIMKLLPIALSNKMIGSIYSK